MVERDYILAATAARLGCASDCLKGVLPSLYDPDLIDEERLNEIKRQIANWFDAVHKRIEQRSRSR